MRNTKARGAVDGLVRTETILVKRLQSRQRTSFQVCQDARCRRESSKQTFTLAQMAQRLPETTTHASLRCATGTTQKEYVKKNEPTKLVTIIFIAQDR